MSLLRMMLVMISECERIHPILLSGLDKVNSRLRLLGSMLPECSKKFEEIKTIHQSAPDRHVKPFIPLVLTFDTGKDTVVSISFSIFFSI